MNIWKFKNVESFEDEQGNPMSSKDFVEMVIEMNKRINILESEIAKLKGK